VGVGEEEIVHREIAGAATDEPAGVEPEGLMAPAAQARDDPMAG